MMMMQQQQQQHGGVPGNSGDSSVATVAEAREGSGGLNEEEKGRSEESERINSGGSRWPRQETIALLKIRFDMDVAFRDSSLKGPLWDEVSRKLSELGYHRSAKKCKEKFENVYKYHKRTKDGRNTKADGKTYRFFEQLEALDTHPSLSLISSSSQAHPTILTSPAFLGNNTSNMNMDTSPVNITVSSNPSPISTFFPSNAIHPINFSSFNIPPQPTVSVTPTINPTQKPTATNAPNLPPSYSNNPSMSFSTSTSADEQQPERVGKRKRKWEEFFGRLMNEVIRKQDELQQKFLDTLERKERDRMDREEAWRFQEMVRVNQERERLLQERSRAATKDAAVISFLQKITEQQQNSPNVLITVPPILTQIQTQPNAVSTAPPPRQQPAGPLQVPQPQPQKPAKPPTVIVSAPAPAPMRESETANLQPSNYIGSTDNNNNNNMLMSPSPSRWPKAEIQALIKLRTTLDTKYTENGPKGPLWEEISGAMRKMGYNRNAKRCKEKWENINKYYKKVKESNKKRREDAKTCPYFHQLEAIYKDKNVSTNITNPFNPNPVLGIKPENPMPSVPTMAQPEQQWSLPQEKQQQHKEANHGSDNINDPDLDDDYEDHDDDGAGYEIATNKQQQQQQLSETTHI